MSRQHQEDLLAALEEAAKRDSQNLFYNMFPDTYRTWRGQEFHPREKYPKHMAFLESTSVYRETAMMAANRSGKTFAGGYAAAVWLTGLYPPWWKGKRFDGPVNGWVAGITNETTRDIIQTTLLGHVEMVNGKKAMSGTGMVPGKFIFDPTWRTGISDTIDVVKIRHTSGQFSRLGVKSYQQGQETFMGTAQHFIWLDEEPTLPIATECLTRTATTNGVLMYTFTPLKGVSEVARRFLPGDDS